MKAGRKTTFIVAALATLLLLNAPVWRAEQTLAHGRRVLLALQPVAADSLQRGSVMLLDYPLQAQISAAMGIPEAERGYGHSNALQAVEGDVLHAMVVLDQHDVAHLSRVGRVGVLPRAGEIPIRVKWWSDTAALPSRSYPLPDEDRGRFTSARYADYRVADDGTALLAGLLDAARRPIDPPDRQ
ncbi:hypothetical protein IGB42_00521 [Andreprevotia sp. IGB-42]|uniref:GDYXXLXY domain-containing protein n=1 Tax=Andreprevotia sp. IGB-42 TaxID=2497473 RepID=UPI001358C93C|nr:GDYXXLXY domain-containing protein [Andreprevotia sp. IGB-42]KAF0815440.1 hypothetical protein IGB42_00521 [Andreprevotia sp. IGB-42]